MVPARPLRRRAAGYAVQAGLGTTVLLAPGGQEALGLRYWGVVILLLPVAVRAVSRTAVTPWQRCWASTVLAVHPIGSMYAVYRNVWWYDHLAHAAAGTLAAGLVYSFVVGSLDRSRLPARGHAVALSLVMLTGVAWELYELQVDYLVVYGTWDTTADLAFDAVGWALAARAWPRIAGSIPRGVRTRLRSLDRLPDPPVR